MHLKWQAIVIAFGLVTAGLTAACSDDKTATSTATAAPTVTATSTQTSVVTASATPTNPVAAGDAVTIKGFVFDPIALTVPVGTTVTWTNDDTVAHRVVGVSADAFNAGTVAAGDTVTATFDAAGTFPYICEFHPQMTGTIIVQ